MLSQRCCLKAGVGRCGNLANLILFVSTGTLCPAPPDSKHLQDMQPASSSHYLFSYASSLCKRARLCAAVGGRRCV